MPKFVPRQRKHKVLQRQRDEKRRHKSQDVNDSNVSEIVPTSETDAERARKKDELSAAIRSEQGSMPSRKKKRLDKYIDKKLRKEENLELIKRLANTKVDTGLLRSSKSFAATKPTKRGVLSRALDETRAGIDVEKNREILFQRQDDSDAESSSEEDASGSETEVVEETVRPAAIFGGGLKRPLENGAAGPLIIKKRRRAVIPFTVPIASGSTQSSDARSDEESWSGFSESISGASDAEENGSMALEQSSDSEVDEGSEVSDEVSESGRESGDERDRKARFSAFRTWATSQINEAAGFTPTVIQNSDPKTSKGPETSNGVQYKPKPMEVDPLPPELAVESSNKGRKAFSVAVDRADDVQARRMELPISGEEQRIMEAIHNNPVVVVCGETGSGKTTQVPQFLYESGYGSADGPTTGMIGITQPRRVAAVSMAMRVADELGGDHAAKVAHQVRFDSSVSKITSIKFMTDGVLLREIANDFALPRYSAIVIDEAHERSANTDILIGLLSRIVDLRETMHKEDANVQPLKLVIMSATLRVQDFVGNRQLFKGKTPPLLQVSGRQHPVTMHFARRTETDYVEQMFRKVCRGHRRLPPGAMLVFLTAQDEITSLIRKLNEELGRRKPDDVVIERDSEESSGNEDGEDFDVDELQATKPSPGVHVLPLYSQLRTEDQLRIFDPPPEGSRLIIVATNIAETSLTIPGVRYVFDCGRSKEKKYDRVSGVQSFEIGWISKASARQRAGRAGRTGPGHCYRVYSSAVYERDFEEHAVPEILRMPVEGVVLQLKSMELHNVINFPFPSPPDRQGLVKAERLLMHLGGLTPDGRVTDSGRDLTVYPMAPRYAKILSIGHQYKCMAFSIRLVAALATPNVFLPQNQVLRVAKNDDEDAEEENAQRKSDFDHSQHLLSRLSRTSDALKMFTALGEYLRAEDKAKCCRQHFLSPKQMHEASELVSQLTSITQNKFPLNLSTSSARLATPTKDQISALQQFVAAGFLDQIAILASAHPSPPYVGRNPKRAIDVPYLPLFPISTSRQVSSLDINSLAVYVYPSSVLAHLPVKDMPKYIIYSHLQRSQPKAIDSEKTPRTRMHPLGTITERAILTLAQGTPLLQSGKPLSILEEKATEKGKTRICVVQPSLVGEKGVMGWPLPAQKVTQLRNAKGEWVVE